MIPGRGAPAARSVEDRPRLAAFRPNNMGTYAPAMIATRTTIIVYSPRRRFRNRSAPRRDAALPSVASAPRIPSAARSAQHAARASPPAASPAGNARSAGVSARIHGSASCETISIPKSTRREMGSSARRVTEDGIPPKRRIGLIATNSITMKRAPRAPIRSGSALAVPWARPRPPTIARNANRIEAGTSVDDTIAITSSREILEICSSESRRRPRRLLMNSRQRNTANARRMRIIPTATPESTLRRHPHRRASGTSPRASLPRSPSEGPRSAPGRRAGPCG